MALKYKNPSRSLNELSFLNHYSWAILFKNKIGEILSKMNSFDSQLSSNELDLLSQFSFNYFEESKISPQSAFTQFEFPINTFHFEKSVSPKPATKNDQKSILFVTGIFPGLSHGGGLRVFDMMQELADRDYYVGLFCPTPQKSDREFVSLVKSTFDQVKICHPKDMNIEFYKKWLKAQKKQFNNCYYVWPYIAPLMYHQQNLFENQIFEFIEVTTRRVWMDLIDYIKTNKFELIPYKIGELWMSYKLELHATRLSSKIICVTQKDADFVNHLYETSVTGVVGTGVSKHAVLDEIQKYSTLTPQKNSVGFLGNYDHYPNLDGIEWYLKFVHPMVSQAVPDYTFHIMGTGDLSRVKSKFKHLKNIQWVGPVKSVVKSLKSIEVCATPLINGAGLRGKVNQYAIVQKPIVSTNIGVCGTPYVDQKDIYIADDPNEFAKRIIFLLKNKNEASKMAQNAYEVVKNNFWDVHINSLQKILT